MKKKIKRPGLVKRNKSKAQRLAVSKSWKGDNKDRKEKISKAVSKSLKGKTGEKARRWLGNEAGYSAIHKWVAKEFGRPTRCEFCNYDKKKRYHWANLSGEYKREREDWVMLCPSCHKKYDVKNKITSEKFRLP